jgi:hypothetical protein
MLPCAVVTGWVEISLWQGNVAENPQWLLLTVSARAPAANATAAHAMAAQSFIAGEVFKSATPPKYCPPDYFAGGADNALDRRISFH